MKRIVGYALMILPATALGVLGMIVTGVRLSLWGQQIAAFFVFALLAYALRKPARKLSPGVWAAALALLLAATLLGAEAGGARRWLDLGIFNVNAAMLVLPAMIILLGHMKRFYPLMLCIAAILCIQPDLSQLTAFAAAALPLLQRSRNKNGWKILSMVLMAVLAVICMNIPMSIESVPYCEGVLAMLGEISWLLMAAGVAALAMIPGFWMYCFAKKQDMWMLSLGIYYTAVILFGLSGEYPVPFMGFGLSPIAGYWLVHLLVPSGHLE